MNNFNAYVAGFFDGEGCVHIKREKGIPSSLSVGITQKDIRPLKKVQEVFGGSIYDHKGSFYQWRINNTASYWFLLAILPYLIVKKDQALAAIDYQHLRDRQGSRHRLTQIERDERENFYELIREQKVVMRS